MTTFDDRERAFENAFAHDQDLAFRAQARRDREIGLWAARQMGLEGVGADAYAAALAGWSVERGGPDAVVAKLGRDLGEHGLHVTEHQIRRRMDELLASAMDEIRRV